MEEDKPKTIQEEAGLPANWKPIDAPPIVPSRYQNSSESSAPFVGSLPPSYQQNTDFSGVSRAGGRVPNLSLMPLGNQGNPSSNAAIISTSTKVIKGSSVELDTNGNLNANQGRLNLIGSGVTLTNDAAGNTTITSTSTGDGLTHGDPVWEHDSAYFEFRDDFFPYLNPTSNNSTTAPIGEKGWVLLGSILQSLGHGGNPPYLGQFGWENNSAASNGGFFALNQINGTAAYNMQSYALLENPGWKATWIFKHDGSLTASAVTFSTAKKAFYIGFSGAAQNAIGTVNTSMRPEIFIGLRFDTSATPGTLTLSAAGNASGGNTIYTGTITGGDNGAYIGISFVVAGFVTGANNGTFTCVASSATTITLNNAAGVSESHAGTAAGGGLNDAFYTFEVVTNRTYTNAARRNAQGTTFVTSIAPTQHTWHRLDITCSATGQVTLTLDGSATNTHTFTVPQITTTLGAAGQVSCTSKVGRIQVSQAAGTAGGTNTLFHFGAGSTITISGLAGGNAGLNGTWLGESSAATGIQYYFETTSADIVNNTTDATIVAYPALFPFCTFGNTDQATPTANSMRTFLDFFSLVWNPNLGPSAPGTPDKTKPRYW